MPDEKSVQHFLSKFGLPQEARESVLALIQDSISDTRSIADTDNREPLVRGETISPAVHTLDRIGPRVTLWRGRDDNTWLPEDPAAQAGKKEKEGAPAPPEDRMTIRVLSPPDKFQDYGRLGEGGMGEVRRVLDRDLNRVIAFKIIRKELMSNPRAVARFVEEAQTTAQLQHPSIVPVHELGRMSDGRLYFTMLEIRGRNFDEVILEHHRARAQEAGESGVTGSGWTFRRLVDVFQKVADAVAYAHSRGVIHRDLKPRNILVGTYGEVLVVDWGLARVLDQPDVMSPIDAEDRVVTYRSQDSAKATLAGTIAGTPAYMPLEQAMGMRERQGAHSDVYSLGAILYEILTGRPPYTGPSAASVLKKVLAGPPPPPDSPGVPDELRDICLKAMERQIDKRYRDAREVSLAVAAWLDGARRREQALQLIEQAQKKSQQSRRLRARAHALDEEARVILSDLAPMDPVEEKRVAWTKQAEAERLAQGAETLDVVVTQLARAALEAAPQLPEAHQFLAEHYKRSHADAEAGGLEVEAKRYELLLRNHDHGAYADYLQGDGALTLHTTPDGATVEIYRYVETDRRLSTVPWGKALKTPVKALTLPRGSYLLVIRVPYRPPVHYPVFIERNGHWDGVPPGAEEPLAIRVPTDAELGEGNVYVPAGWYLSGGDPSAPNSMPRRRLWLDAYVIRRFPISNREYIEFLDDLVNQRRPEDARRFVPRARSATFGQQGPPIYGQDAYGLHYLQADADGDKWERDWPVLMIDWHGANAYASWKAVQTEHRWRLPTEYEWEKAARGVDGRQFPWGNYLDPTWCRMRQSHRGRAMPGGIEEFPLDVSPYGVRGMGGNVRDWCRNYYTMAGPPVENHIGVLSVVNDPTMATDYRAVRGGAWTAAVNECRIAYRYGYSPGDRHPDVGVRLVRPLGPTEESSFGLRTR